MDSQESIGTFRWWERDKKILERLIHPLTAWEIIDLFPNDDPDPVRSQRKSLDAASHRLKRLWERGKIHRVGYDAKPYGGRALYVYCRRAVKADLVEHELGLTRFLRLYPTAKTVRGYDVDQKYLPDAEMTLKALVMVEWVTRHTKFKAFIDRLKKYRDCEAPVIWVCPDSDMAERLRRAAKDIDNNSLFGTFSEAQADPHGMIWQDCDGEFQGFEEPVQNPS